MEVVEELRQDAHEDHVAVPLPTLLCSAVTGREAAT
jgi:hypothetical protein